MGLFSKIKSAVKSVWKGVKKVFKPIVKGIGKIFGSKLGKGLLMAASVFTMGTALAAGASAWSAAASQGATTFLGKFVPAAQNFMSSLTGGLVKAPDVVSSGAQAAGQAAQAVAEQGAKQGQQLADVAGAAGDVMKQTDPMTKLAEGAAGGTSAISGPASSLPVGGGAPSAAASGTATAGQTGNMLSKASNLAQSAAKGVLEFAKSPGGGRTIGSIIQGYGEGMAAEAEWERRDELERRGTKGLQKLNQTPGAFDIDVPAGLRREDRRTPERRRVTYDPAAYGAGQPQGA